MAKELPYFKFEPSEWDNGNIQMCSRESKGLFIDLCSIYWSRLGELPYALALQKLCNGKKDALQELQDHQIFGVVDGHIVIEFLNEQLAERGETSEKRRDAAKKRWSDANALQLESKCNASREEENRKEKKREEKITAVAVPFVGEVLKFWNEWEKFRIEKKAKLTPTTIRKQIQFLGGRGDPEIIAILNQSMTSGYTGLFELKKDYNGNGNRDTKTPRRADAIIEPGKDFGTF
jgi:hypothetical protein